MKQFILATCPKSSSNTIAYGGYINRINVNRILLIYSVLTSAGYVHEIVVDFGSHVETWEVDENTYNDLLDIEY